MSMMKNLTLNGVSYEIVDEQARLLANAAISSDEKGAASGVATLDENGKVVASQLPEMGDLASKDLVAEADLNSELKTKINNTANNSHTHENKDILDGITAEKIASWDATQPNVIEKVTIGGTEVEIADRTLALGALAGKDKVNFNDLSTLTLERVKQGAAAYMAAKDFITDNGENYSATSIKTYVDEAAIALSNRLTTLEGSDAGKSARTIAAEELAAQLVPESAKESLDTLAEIAAWIQSHPDDASAMNEAITAIQSQLNGIDAGDGTVKKYVDDSIAAIPKPDMSEYSTTEEMNAAIEAAFANIAKAEEVAW